MRIKRCWCALNLKSFCSLKQVTLGNIFLYRARDGKNVHSFDAARICCLFFFSLLFFISIHLIKHTSFRSFTTWETFFLFFLTSISPLLPQSTCKSIFWSLETLSILQFDNPILLSPSFLNYILFLEISNTRFRTFSYVTCFSLSLSSSWTILNLSGNIVTLTWHCIVSRELSHQSGSHLNLSISISLNISTLYWTNFHGISLSNFGSQLTYTQPHYVIIVHFSNRLWNI